MPATTGGTRCCSRCWPGPECVSGEALGLRHEDIGTADRVVRVQPRRNANRARAKTGARDIPVTPGLVRLFADYLFEEYGSLDCDYVFVNHWADPVGAPMTYANVIDLVGRLRSRTGIHFTPHLFQHTYATELLNRDVPSEVVQKLLVTRRCPPRSTPTHRPVNTRPPGMLRQRRAGGSTLPDDRSTRPPG
jgi:integrase